jgi:hypothetical protein
MKRLLNLLASLHRRRRRPAQPPRRHISLQLETLEGRLVPSAARLPLPAPALAPALAAPETTGGAVTAPVGTEQCVHGYKWRRPHPWDGQSGTGPAIALKVIIAETPPVSLHISPPEPPAPATVAA